MAALNQLASMSGELALTTGCFRFGCWIIVDVLLWYASSALQCTRCTSLSSFFSFLSVKWAQTNLEIPCLLRTVSWLSALVPTRFGCASNRSSYSNNRSQLWSGIILPASLTGAHITAAVEHAGAPRPGALCLRHHRPHLGRLLLGDKLLLVGHAWRRQDRNGGAGWGQAG